jgi:hypothetical protein
MLHLSKKANAIADCLEDHASMSGARTYIQLPLGHMLANGHWSFYGERLFGSTCVGAQTARLQGVVYKYHLLWLHCGSCLFCAVGGSHTVFLKEYFNVFKTKTFFINMHKIKYAMISWKSFTKIYFTEVPM